MVWEEPVVQDALFGNVVRNLLWAGFGTLVVARPVMAALALVAILAPAANGNASGPAMAWFVFSTIDALASLAFVGALVVAALVTAACPPRAASPCSA